MLYRLFLLLSITLLLLSSCRKNKSEKEIRSFYMGATPWPGDFNSTEVETAYNFINAHCDIVSHHFDDGIPYDEAFHKINMPTGLAQDVQTRKAKTAPDKKVFLSVAPLDLSRKEKAAYYSQATVTDSIKNYWNNIPFNDDRIITAYTNYISWLIDQFNPIYVNYGVESNNPLWDLDKFALYKDFLSKVYSRLKAKYGPLTFFVSFIVDESTEGFNSAKQLIPYTDFIGLSAYPYVSVSSSSNGSTDPALFPPNYIEKFITLDAAKPFVFAETGYIAEDLVIPSFSLNKQGNENWQEKYLAMICKLCNDRKGKMLIWFCSKDYDKGNITLGSLGLYKDLFSLWQDTGLINENGDKRPAYQTWLQWMAKEKN